MHWSTIWRPKSVPIKGAAKTITLQSCDAKKKNYEARPQSWWKEEKFRRRDERIAWPERQMMLASKILHIYRVFLYIPFQRMLLYSQNGRVSIVYIEVIYLLNVMGLMLRNGFKDGCFQHIPQVKSGEDNQWIQLKRMLITGPVPTPCTIVQHSFRLTFRKRRMVSSLSLFISRAWDVLVLSLVFPHDYIYIFLIVWKSFQL